MTAQITDTYKYNGVEYRIIATTATSNLGFDPEEYNLHPTAPHTACWRGYVCQYEIRNEKLYLNELNIHCDNKECPELFGVKPEPRRGGLYDGFYRYKRLNKLMEYTGSIILGNDCVPEYCVNMGFQNALAYRNVIELNFIEGYLIEKNNYSSFVDKLREEEGITRAKQSVRKFVEESFSLDAKVKAPWVL